MRRRILLHLFLTSLAIISGIAAKATMVNDIKRLVEQAELRKDAVKDLADAILNLDPDIDSAQEILDYITDNHEKLASTFLRRMIFDTYNIFIDHDLDNGPELEMAHWRNFWAVFFSAYNDLSAVRNIISKVGDKTVIKSKDTVRSNSLESVINWMSRTYDKNVYEITFRKFIRQIFQHQNALIPFNERFQRLRPEERERYHPAVNNALALQQFIRYQCKKYFNSELLDALLLNPGPGQHGYRIKHFLLDSVDHGGAGISLHDWNKAVGMVRSNGYELKHLYEVLDQAHMAIMQTGTPSHNKDKCWRATDRTWKVAITKSVPQGVQWLNRFALFLPLDGTGGEAFILRNKLLNVFASALMLRSSDLKENRKTALKDVLSALPQGDDEDLESSLQEIKTIVQSSYLKKNLETNPLAQALMVADAHRQILLSLLSIKNPRLNKNAAAKKLPVELFRLVGEMLIGNRN